MTSHIPAIARPTFWRKFAVIAMVFCLTTVMAQPISAHQGHNPASTQEQQSSPESDGGYDQEWIMAALRPDVRESTVALMPDGLPIYQIGVSLDTDSAAPPTLSGTLGLTWTNTTGEAIDSLPFRLYANGPADNHDAQIVSDVMVDGEPAGADLSVDNTVLQVPLGQGLAAGKTTTISMDFAATLPIDSEDHYGIFGFDSDAETWALAHWYPVVAGRDPSSGWMLDSPSSNGDPIFTDTALYDVAITTGADWQLATTGVEYGDPEERSDETITRRYVSGPARDFTIAADEDFELVTREVDGITINSWFNPGDERVATAVADFTAQSLALFSDLLSPYPFVELDVLPVNMSGAAGAEFSQLIYMGAGYYQANTDLSTPNQLDYTMAHEVVHQWLYGLVGNNQYAHAFIDEGITNFLSAQVYFELQYGEEEAEAIMDRYIRAPFASIVERDRDQIVDMPTDDFATGNDYVFAAYAKAPLGFEAIRAEIGDDAFFGALAAYVDQFTFLVAEPDQMLDAFEQASGKDLTGLWNEWFEETNGEDALDQTSRIRWVA